MPESAITNLGPDGDSGKHGGRPGFVEFRNRIQRLVDSLVGLRTPSAPGPFGDARERVEVSLESEEIAVEFFVADLPWKTTSGLIHQFQDTFAKFAPVFLDASGLETLKVSKSAEKEGSFRTLYTKEDTTLTLDRDMLHVGYSIKIRTNLKDFNDHFEVFVTEAARAVFPPTQKPARQNIEDLESWQREFGRPFEEMGCRVLCDSDLGWKDLAGLTHLRERLERSVFRPLAREQLYQKIALHVMPHRVNVLPRGVLLYGPPGCGKTWSMRVIAGEAGLPVVVLPCDAVLTKWYGESERRLASLFAQCRAAGRMILLIDEVDALARHRSESHEATARLVSILLSEMDGLMESADILLVGAANTLESLDRAVLDRFDLKIEFALPDRAQLQAALAYYARQLSDDDVAEIVERLGGWNFRKIARFAEEVLRTYVSNLDLTLLEARDPPLPKKADYLEALAGFQ
jgi:SpoVK/Ycf46/Vps4 family AAA+-type ATPase